MNYKIMNREQIEASKDVSAEVLAAIEVNKYPVYLISEVSDRDVLLFCNEELTDLQDSIELILEGTVLSEGYTLPESGPVQLFMNTQPPEKEDK
jgi:hypothetical protein